jgi:hypothetical protein
VAGVITAAGPNCAQYRLVDDKILATCALQQQEPVHQFPGDARIAKTPHEWRHARTNCGRTPDPSGQRFGADRAGSQSIALRNDAGGAM